MGPGRSVARFAFLTTLIGLGCSSTIVATRPMSDDGGPLPPVAGSTLKVHLDSKNANVELWRSGNTDELICTAPCDQLLDLAPSASSTSPARE